MFISILWSKDLTSYAISSIQSAFLHPIAPITSPSTNVEICSFTYIISQQFFNALSSLNINNIPIKTRTPTAQTTYTQT